jgi:hypothetical protein
MAISASISLTSAAGDLTSNALTLSSVTSLTKAGTSTALAQTTGLARKTTSAAAAGNIQATYLFRGDDATTNGANKVYLKNTSSTSAEYYTVHVDQEELGRLYAGDWAFFPWNAAAGSKAYFTLTIAGSWVSGDTWEFDGVKATATNATESDFCAIIDSTNYPNWTTDYAAGETTIVFHARQSGGLTQSTAVTADGTKSSSSGTAVISSAHAGTTKSESDISVRPSVHTDMTIEYALFYQ